MVINMNIGGTEKALLNMISEMPKEQYDITIMMLEKSGGFLDYIPKHVHVKCFQDFQRIKGLLNFPLQNSALHFLKSGKFLKAFSLMWIYFITKLLNDRSILFEYLLREHEEIRTEYDTAIAYAGPMDFISYFVLNRINAKKKIQWIHFDVTKIGFNKKFAGKHYEKFNGIFVVSDEGRRKLINILPNLEKRVNTYINNISPTSLDRLAIKGKGFTDDFSGIRILTVGRLSKEKGQDLAIHVLTNLKAAGYKVRWYCIGDGIAKSEYESLIEKLKVKSDFILLGSDPNPYPYMSQCDIYIQPSRHEGYCITLAEAKHFEKPIISTNFTGAREQLDSYHMGFVVNLDQQEMYLEIKRLIDDGNLKIKQNMNLKCPVF